MTTYPNATEADLQRPSDLMWQSEALRAAGELMRFWASLPELAGGSPSDGHPVLVLPGFLTDDLSTSHLRTFLRSHGYRCSGWQLGANLGPTPRLWNGSIRKLDSLFEKTGRRVSLIGQSLGGIFARELARRRPDVVRQVITLGSPFRLTAASPPTLTTVGHLYDSLAWMHADLYEDAPTEAERQDLRVPATSIYSRLDGVVPWRACLDVDRPRSESIRVDSSHCGMAFHPAVVRIILDRLARPEYDWAPFRSS